MFLVLIAWLYVTLLMGIAEASAPNGTVLGGIVTFVLYGLIPAAIVGYILATPARKRALRARREAEAAASTPSQTQAAMRPVPPRRAPSRRWEKNREGLLKVHQGQCHRCRRPAPPRPHQALACQARQIGKEFAWRMGGRKVPRSLRIVGAKRGPHFCTHLESLRAYAGRARPSLRYQELIAHDQQGFEAKMA